MSEACINNLLNKKDNNINIGIFVVIGCLFVQLYCCNVKLNKLLVIHKKILKNIKKSNTLSDKNKNTINVNIIKKKIEEKSNTFKKDDIVEDEKISEYEAEEIIREQNEDGYRRRNVEEENEYNIL